MRTWLRFPFAVGGPLSLVVFGAFASACAVIALVVDEDAQALPVAVAFLVTFGSLELARRRFIQRRGRPYRFRAFPSGRLSWAVYLPLLVVCLWIVRDLSWGWTGVVAAALFLAYEAVVRAVLTARGVELDPRSARDWRPPTDEA